ncbi:MAG TPA: pyridoxal-phosphate dependent enzyme [Anaerolineales bacterium]|nr:pyridoxal-phosphate dependent enzyme [Anaerolineales bacterium]
MSLAATAPQRVGWTWPFVCSRCGRPYPSERLTYRCPACDGLYDLASPIRYAPGATPRNPALGISHYQVMSLPRGSEWVSLGEGSTPLVGFELEGRKSYFKCEHLNPTGSFKDRGSAVIVSALAASGVGAAVEDSSGNAGASFAAYAARAGIAARVFVPEYASGPKQAQIALYGADVVRVPGPRSAASQAVAKEVEAGAIYASHVYLPFVLAGTATVAFEIVEQLGAPPGSVIVPVGQGTLLLGLERGFQAMLAAGAIDRLPYLVGVQAAACAPLWAGQSGKGPGSRGLQEGETIAEGIRILHPARGDAVLQAVEGTRGMVVAVEEDEIRAGRQALAKMGFNVEPTSAVVWPAFQTLCAELRDPIVAVLTGSGYKTPW